MREFPHFTSLIALARRTPLPPLRDCAAPCCATLRVGFAANNALFYATGGYAHIGTETSASFLDVTATERDNRGGWTVGGGIELGFTPNWSLKAEYLYIRSFDEDITFFGVPIGWRLETHVARIGLNYRFGGGAVVARY
jgi:outer membrane immunogenic protein